MADGGPRGDRGADDAGTTDADADSGAAAGQEGGPCFASGRCEAGLICVDATCVQAAEVVDGGDASLVVDAGERDGGSVPGEDAGAEGPSDAGVAGSALQILSFPPASTGAGQPFLYRVVPNQPGHVNYALESGPFGATIDGTGTVRWVPTEEDAGSAHGFLVRVSDGTAQVTQEFVLHVPRVEGVVSTVVRAAEPTSLVVSAPLSPAFGASVSVPEGALPSGTAVSVGMASAVAPLPAAEASAGTIADVAVFDFGPSGAVFADPARLVVPIAPPVVSRARDGGRPIEVWTMRMATGTWERIPVVSVDLAAGTAVVDASHFSLFAAVDGSPVIRPPIAARGSDRCPTLLAVPAGLAVPLGALRTAWMNASGTGRPPRLDDAIAALADDERVTLVFVGTLSRSDGTTQRQTLIHTLERSPAGGWVAAVTDEGGQTLATTTGAAPTEPDVLALFQGAGTRLMFDGAATTTGRVRVRAYGYFNNRSSPRHAPTTLGRAFADDEQALDTLALALDDDDCDGVSDDVDEDVMGAPPPTLSVVGPDVVRAIVGQAVRLEVSVTGEGTASPSWSAGTGSLTSSDTRATFTALVPGTHAVGVQVSNAGGSARATFTILAEAPQANTPPRCAVSAASTQVFSGESVRLAAVGEDDEQPGELLSYRWSSAYPGLTQTSGAEVVFVPVGTGDMTVSCTAHDGTAEGPAGAVTISVVERPENMPPVIAFASPAAAQVTLPEEGGAASVVVVVVATDPDGDPVELDLHVTGSGAATLAHSDGTGGSIMVTMATPGAAQLVVRARDPSGLTSLPVAVPILAAAAQATQVDADGDGYPVGLDCDDGNADIRPAAVEVCGDGVDDDCDGEAPGPEACDADRDGVSTLEGDCDDSDRLVFPGAYERCDARDNDCDATADEGFVFDAACSAGLGACLRGGMNGCSSSGFGTVCAAEPGPRGAETCNAVDDDCDGIPDNAPGVGQGCTNGQVGVCARNGIRACVEGNEQPSCTAPPIAPGSELCGNGLDDDCDGQADEGFDIGAACDNGGLGRCFARGVTACRADGTGTFCDAVGDAPGVEECNAIDDDCDGFVDEGLSGQVDLADGTDNDCDGLVDEDVPQPAVCGDGVKVAPEACDDGNARSGDGCSSLCRTEPGFICTGQGANSCRDVNECTQPVCDPNAACANTRGGYTCTCLEGFEGNGVVCSEVDECADAPCLNGALCIDEVAAFTCACAAGFAGPLCEVDLDDCAASPCLNGAACVDGVDSFSCVCAPGWMGATCAAPDPCAVGSGACDDGDPCTAGDVCVAGACLGTAITRESFTCDSEDEDCDGTVDEDCAIALRGGLVHLPSLRGVGPTGEVLEIFSPAHGAGTSTSGAHELTSR